MWRFFIRQGLFGKSVIVVTGITTAYYGGAEVCYGRKGLPPEAPSTISFNAYRLLPLNLLSRGWGWLCSTELQISLRKPLIGLYATMFNCNLEEAEESDISSYSSLSEFFRRPLKKNVRHIDESSLVSPCDGRILSFGEVHNNEMEQIKGVAYTVDGFLGPDEFSNHKYPRKVSDNSSLYHCIIYLAPGDYHRFHSPADWEISYRRYFPGYLLSVNPRVAAWIRGLFSINERVIYYGKWRHGFFAFAAVGATNVGSIKIFDDQTLVTNSVKSTPNGFEEIVFNREINHQTKGRLFGEFNLGSSIVLIFEAPKNFEFDMSPGDRITVGQSLQKS